MSQVQKKELNEETKIAIVDLVVDETLEALQDLIIKKYLQNIYVVCNSTQNIIYKSYADGMKDASDFDFYGSLVKDVEDWSKSKGSLLRQALNAGQELNSESGYYARKTEEELIKGVMGIRVSDKIDPEAKIDFKGGVSYTDSEIVEQLKKLKTTASKEAEELFNRSKSKCEEKIEENIFFKSILTLLINIEGRVMGYLDPDSDSELKKLESAATAATTEASNKAESAADGAKKPIKLNIRLKNPGDNNN
ncbi:MAG: hypothetical protein IJ757_00875 [Clostridiales bacterium]|nr:hypothetical protein [Clostridiales bacterium]